MAKVMMKSKVAKKVAKAVEEKLATPKKSKEKEVVVVDGMTFKAGKLCVSKGKYVEIMNIKDTKNNTKVTLRKSKDMFYVFSNAMIKGLGDMEFRPRKDGDCYAKKVTADVIKQVFGEKALEF